MACIIGIDPSVRSTGVCVWDDEYKRYKYYLLVKNPTKKVQNFKHNLINIISFEEEPQKDKSAIQKEVIKSNSVYKISNLCNKIFQCFHPKYAVIEAVAFAANGKIDELAGLNYAIRCAAIENGIPIYPVSPTSNKMEFVGNGGATKEMMIDAWKGLRPEASEFEPLGKHLADLADAYSLVHFPFNKF